MSYEQLASEQLLAVLAEKKHSLTSKTQDDTATSADKLNLDFLNEVYALAENRSKAMWHAASGEGTAFVERTATHYPHIRQHGGTDGDGIFTQPHDPNPKTQTAQGEIRLHGGVIDY